MAQIQYKFNKNDEYYTPAYAVFPILKHLKPNSTIWCPFDKDFSKFVEVFESNGHSVIHTHIEDGYDFFDVDIPKCDYIISNPPYSLKTEVFEKLYEIGKPFAMLINFQGIFDNKKRFELFKNNFVEMLWINPRVNYINPNCDKKVQGVPFQSGYLCSNILPNQLMFEGVSRG